MKAIKLAGLMVVGATLACGGAPDGVAAGDPSVGSAPSPAASVDTAALPFDAGAFVDTAAPLPVEASADAGAVLLPKVAYSNLPCATPQGPDGISGVYALRFEAVGNAPVRANELHTFVGGVLDTFESAAGCAGFVSIGPACRAGAEAAGCTDGGSLSYAVTGFVAYDADAGAVTPGPVPFVAGSESIGTNVWSFTGAFVSPIQ